MYFFKFLTQISLKTLLVLSNFVNPRKIEGHYRLQSLFPFIQNRIFRVVSLLGILCLFWPGLNTNSVQAEENRSLLGSISQRIFKNQHPKEEEPVPPVEVAPLKSVLPADTLLLIQVPSMKHLNERGKYLLSQWGVGSLGPLDWLKLLPFGQSFPYLNQNKSAAFIYCPGKDGLAPFLILPVKNYKGFVTALGGDVSQMTVQPEEGKCADLKSPPDYCSVFFKGYAVLTPKQNQNLLKTLFVSSGKFQGNVLHPASGISRTDIRVEVFSKGIPQFAALFETLIHDLTPVWTEYSKSNSISEVDLPPETQKKIISFIENTVRRVENNLQAFRLDLFIGENEVLTSLSFIPRAGSEWMTQIFEHQKPEIPITLNRDHFFHVLPETETPLSGKLNFTRQIASQLPPPYDRIRYIEYSLSLPAQNQLLAESWNFLLEVDDSQEFVRELIIPKAQEIGSYVGAKGAGEIGAQILGNMALRRQTRQQGRNRAPRRPADPEAAAAFGQEIGSLLGAEIGKSAGEKEGMKTYDFEGFPLYVSDLAFYTQQKAIIDADRQGRIPERRPALDGSATLRMGLGSMIADLDSGNLEQRFRATFMQYAAQDARYAESVPLFAKNNFILILDKKHLLIVPGNQNLLKVAKDNWLSIYANESIRNQLPGIGSFSPVRENSWKANWQALCQNVPNIESHAIQGATRIDPVNVLNLFGYLRQNYLRNLPPPILKNLPDDTPQILSITTVNNDNPYHFSVVPHKLMTNIIQEYLHQKTAVKQTGSGNNKPLGIPQKHF